MSTLAHVFEAAGMATVALGSVRKQIESTAPPRGLWCDFPLGRPLGKPGDPARGGLPFDEYMRRQALHRRAEINALLDTPAGLVMCNRYRQSARG
mgnify:CR=1 FL=1